MRLCHNRFNEIYIKILVTKCHQYANKYPRYKPDTHNILTQIFCKQQLFIIFLRTNFTKATFL